jgi:hypothetical protein
VVTADVLVSFRNRQLPTVERVLASLEADMSKVEDELWLENIVYGYLQDYIQNLGSQQLRWFLIFVTASDMLPIDTKLSVTFNGLQGLTRRPTAMTCTNQLMLSREYINAGELASELDQVIGAGLHFDSV